MSGVFSKEQEHLISSIPFGPLLNQFVIGSQVLDKPWFKTLSPLAQQSYQLALTSELSALSHRVLFCEYSKFRAAVGFGKKVLNERQGIFTSFCEELISNNFELISRDYPVWRRLVDLILIDGLNHLKVLLKRLKDDADRLVSVGGAMISCDPKSLIKLTPFCSDRHDGGHSVVRLEFEKGRALYYKPRSFENESIFEFVADQFESAGGEEIKRVPFLDCGEYGWSLEAAYSGEANVHKFRQSGKLLGIIEFLAGGDFHSENIIWSSDGPVIIDLEGLIQPLTHVNQSLKLEILERSCLIPGRFAEGVEAADLSGIRGRLHEEQKVSRYKNVNGDWMLPDSSEDVTSFAKNLPLTESGELMVSEILASYRKSCEIFETYGARWIAGIRAKFVEHRSRVLYRPTSQYGMLIRDSLDPELLRCELKFKTHFENGLRSSPGAHEIGELIIQSEVESLRQLDIPRFQSLSRNGQVVDDNGANVSKFSLPGYTVVENACHEQVPVTNREAFVEWRIRGIDHLAESLSFSGEEMTAEIGIEILANRITNVWRSADRTGTSQWLEASSNRQGFPTGLLECSLYSGYSGVAISLVAAGKTIDDPKILEAGLEVDSRWRETFDSEFSSDWIEFPGAFEGVGSMLYYEACMNHFLNRSGLTDIQAQLMECLNCIDWESYVEGKEWDVIGGLSGLAGCLNFTGMENETLRQIIESEVITRSRATPAAGFGHGITGAAFCLRNDGKGGEKYGEWNDLLSAEIKELASTDSNTWCRGFSGLAFGRMLSGLQTPQEALQKLISGDIHVSDHLCCGNGGRLWMAHQISCTNPEIIPMNAVKGASDKFLERILRPRGLRLPDGSTVIHCGFFRGTSGLAYLFSRMVDPELPDVLSLEFPDSKS